VPALRKNPMSAGPWKGVRTTTEPYDDDAALLLDARNGYIADPSGLSSFASRPGFVLDNGGNAIFTSASAFRGQGIFTHTELDGTTINFVAMGGHLFRVDGVLSTFTDVTPGGVTIDADISTRVAFCDLVGTMVVTDGVNRPWIASNLTSTPITGTYIDYDSLGTSWSAFGAPRVYGGSMFFILNQVNGISRRQDISWCESGDPSIGYQQTDFDDNWTLITSSSGALFALWGTNNYLYFFREASIGTIAGEVGPTLASTATEDSIGFNVGAQAWATMTEYGNTLYFCDGLGRPYSVRPGEAPKAIWLQMRQIVDESTIAFPAVTARDATGAFESTLNLWLVAIWSPTPSVQAAPLELYAWDVRTGTYVGRWDIGDGCSIECLGSVQDSSGRSVLMMLGSAIPGGASGYAWSFNSLLGTPEALTTEGGVLLTTEGGVQLTTEGQDEPWTDNGSVPTIQAVTNYLGYADDLVWNVDQAVIVTLSDAPCLVSIGTTALATTVEGTPSPSASQNGTYRLVVGMEAQGRGPSVTIQPTTATQQWSVQSVSLRGIPSVADPLDP